MNLFYKFALLGSAALCAIIVGYSLIPSDSPDDLADNQPNAAQSDAGPEPDPADDRRDRPTLADSTSASPADPADPVAPDRPGPRDLAPPSPDTSDSPAQPAGPPQADANANADASIDTITRPGDGQPAADASIDPEPGQDTLAMGPQLDPTDPMKAAPDPALLLHAERSQTQPESEPEPDAVPTIELREREPEPQPQPESDPQPIARNDQNTSRTSNEPSQDPEHTTHTVRSGQTLSAIAAQTYGHQRYWQVIAQANPTVDPHHLRPGQELRLPDPDHVHDQQLDDDLPDRPEGNTHTVRSGQTLSAIARQHYDDPTRWREIYDANRDAIGDSPDRLRAGIELRIPADD